MIEIDYFKSYLVIFCCLKLMFNNIFYWKKKYRKIIKKINKNKPEEAAPALEAEDIPVACSLSATLSASFSFASAQKQQQ